VRVAVAGGTGLAGRHVVEALRRLGHEPVVVARSTGADVSTGVGLEEALARVDAVVDATNFATLDPAAAREVFGTATANLLRAERAVGVKHHVVLSIVGIDRVEGTGHYAGKRRQEELVHEGRVAFSIVRATQFHDFAAMVVGWTRRDDVAVVPPLLVQPVAVADVANVLAEAATSTPTAGMVEVAGPEPQDLVDMARRTLTARGESIRLVPSWRGPVGPDMAGEVLLPGPGARLMPTTFDEWLAAQ
jgi:uncharacterized protein YbjT (DUF2867 family)